MPFATYQNVPQFASKRPGLARELMERPRAECVEWHVHGNSNFTPDGGAGDWRVAWLEMRLRNLYGNPQRLGWMNASSSDTLWLRSKSRQGAGGATPGPDTLPPGFNYAGLDQPSVAAGGLGMAYLLSRLNTNNVRMKGFASSANHHFDSRYEDPATVWGGPDTFLDGIFYTDTAGGSVARFGNAPVVGPGTGYYPAHPSNYELSAGTTAGEALNAGPSGRPLLKATGPYHWTTGFPYPQAVITANAWGAPVTLGPARWQNAGADVGVAVTCIASGGWMYWAGSGSSVRGSHANCGPTLKAMKQGRRIVVLLVMSANDYTSGARTADQYHADVESYMDWLIAATGYDSDDIDWILCAEHANQGENAGQKAEHDQYQGALWEIATRRERTLMVNQRDWLERVGIFPGAADVYSTDGSNIHLTDVGALRASDAFVDGLTRAAVADPKPYAFTDQDLDAIAGKIERAGGPLALARAAAERVEGRAVTISTGVASG